MKENELKVGGIYKGKTGNIFKLLCEYSPNRKCFRRQDGQLHYGREFIEYRYDERVIDLEPEAL